MKCNDQANYNAFLLELRWQFKVLEERTEQQMLNIKFGDNEPKQQVTKKKHHSINSLKYLL